MSDVSDPGGSPGSAPAAMWRAADRRSNSAPGGAEADDARMGRWIAKHRRVVIVGWLVVVVGLSVAARFVDHESRSSFAVPGSESDEALGLLGETFPALATAQATVVYHAPDGQLVSGASAGLVDDTVTRLRALDVVADVTSPTEVPQRFFDVSDDGTVAYSTVRFTDSLEHLPADTFSQLVDAVSPARDAGLVVELDGQIVDQQNTPRGGLSDYADVISIVVAIAIITVAFGAPLMALLPIGIALVALGTGLSLLAFVEHWFVIASVNEVLGTMLALGVGIDYSLLLINRYRQLLAEGRDPTDALALALSTAGRSILLAGATVCVATVALFIIGVPLVTKLGLTTAMFVAITVVTALTLLPALLAMVGGGLDRWALPWAGSESRFWPRWAATNERHRWAFAVVPLVVLAVLFVPVASADLGIIDDGSLPTSVTQRRAYDLVADGFGPGFNGPLVVISEVPEGTTAGEVAVAAGRLDLAVRGTDGVAQVSPPRFSSRANGGEAATEPSSETRSVVFRVIPSSSPDDDATAALVGALRDEVIPSALDGTAIDAHSTFVGGQTAVFIDFTDRIQARLVSFIAVVLALSFFLLLAGFRSLIVPLKAAVMALVSFLAAYGATIAVFQWGWLRNVVGLEAPVPIETFFPLMLFAILFGLSMDYEVFLVSRVREELDGGRNANDAVTAGLATTGKMILSAGIIMTSVFLAFATNPSPVIKQIAFGLAFAIAIDAMIIRLAVVPAWLHVFGRHTWWLPRPLERRLPHLEVS